MSRQRDTMRRRHDKLTEREMRDLIREYDIEFKGPLTPSLWPKNYYDLFLRVREIGFTEFEKYQPDGETDRSLVDKMKRRAVELTRIAYGDRRGRVNEPTLRGNTEPLVFARFQAEVKCDEPGETLLFANYSDKFIQYDPRDGLEMRGLQKRKPDRVFGLSRTESLVYFSKTDLAKDLRHSPFPDADMFYPFLILEAKSEGGGLGFESIETQTAFPIRTCVKLQDDLRRRSSNSMDPLLWFMSYEGDEWRVAACIVHSEKFEDSDRETAGSTDTAPLSNLMLDDTVMEDQPVLAVDQDDEPYKNTPSHPLLKWVNTSPSDTSWIRHGTIRHVNMPLFMFSHLALPEDPDTLAACLQQMNGLTERPVRDIALGLIESFRDPMGAVSTSLNRILQLKNEWLKEGSNVTVESESPVRALFSFRTSVRSSDWQILRGLWCISCTLLAALELAKVAGVDLGELSSRTWWSIDTNLFSLSVFSSLRSLTRKDSATAALNSIILYLTVQGKVGDQYCCQWIPRNASERIPASFTLLLPKICRRGTLASAVDQATALMEVLEKPLPQDLRALLGPQLSVSRATILLRRGQHWPEITPQWCLMVLNEIDFEDNRQLGRSLAEVKDKGLYYTFTFASSYDEAGEPTEELIDQSVDVRFLDTWINHLLS
ncbi:hypothetical protein AOQ84DRAFT_361218 [Glonium stellatum]|uniref:Uncharacterized protein n=1 Tax=Glonium stellatum TaxID=574774 RepID=A0A8E2F7A0_9PEZI|nr:hypothetical protein AOQ84DRAFT_361218 [Glonium stellatum]